MQPQSFDLPMWQLPTALAYTGISRTSWLGLVKAGKAPAPVKVPGRRIVRWRASDVRTWVDSLPVTREVEAVE